MEGTVDVLTVPAITAVVYAMIAMSGGLIPSRLKPPVAALLGVGWAVVAHLTIADSYANVLAAVAVGLTAAAAASGVESYRQTYR